MARRIGDYTSPDFRARRDELVRAAKPSTRSPSEKSCSPQSETVGADLVRSELTFEYRCDGAA